MRKIITSLAGAVMLMASLPAVSALAQTSVSGTATLNTGDLALGTVNPVNFGAATLTGFGQTLSTSNVADLRDARGTGGGWRVSIRAIPFGANTTGLFTNGSHTLADGSMTVSGGSTSIAPGFWVGTQPVNSDNAYPYPVLTTGATNIFNAGLNTGLGNGGINFGDALAVPADAYAGAYSTTLAYSLIAGP